MLRAQMNEGQIADLETQPKYRVCWPDPTDESVPGQYLFTITPDFRYRDITTDEIRVEDAKYWKTTDTGKRVPVLDPGERLKAKLLRLIEGVEIIYV